MDKKVTFVLTGSLAIVVIYLAYEHRVHIVGNIQYLLLGSFIGLHLLMHLGHRGHGGHSNNGDKKGGSRG